MGFILSGSNLHPLHTTRDENAGNHQTEGNWSEAVWQKHRKDKGEKREITTKTAAKTIYSYYLTVSIA